jgi:hypothetical protein
VAAAAAAVDEENDAGRSRGNIDVAFEDGAVHVEAHKLLRHDSPCDV